MKNARPQTTEASALYRRYFNAVRNSLPDIAANAVWLLFNLAAAFLILGGCNG